MNQYTFLFITTILISNALFSQDSDLLGEDFDLEALPAVLEKVYGFEELEKAINDSNNAVNNLDLDNNGEVDYITIQEEADGETHIAYLRVALSEDEFQDIATIEMEKKSASLVTFQIVGDTGMYGDDYILEPEGGIVDISEEAEIIPYEGEHGPSPYSYIPPPAVRVRICVGVYRPGYVVYVSPYGFRVHPVWFRPWRPMGRSAYRKRSSRMHRNSFRRTSNRRSTHAKTMQTKSRNKSAQKNQQQKSNQPQNNTQQKSNQQHHNTAPNRNTGRGGRRR